MRPDRRLYLILGIVAAVCIGGYVGLSLFSPIRQSESTIREYVLADAPLGSSVQQVLDSIRKHQWGYVRIDMNAGFQDHRERPPRIVGTKSIRAQLGHYQGIPWRTYVSVFWGFDDQDRLIDVWVWKDEDTL